MAIRVEHGPSMATLGRMSYGAGKAIGEEESQRYLLDQWQKYYGVKKPLEVQERIADKNLAYQREDLGVRKDWFDRNYILDEQRVGFEGERLGIDRERLGIDQQQVDQQLQIASLNAAMQGQIAQYQANSQAGIAAMQMGKNGGPAPRYGYTRSGNTPGGSMTYAGGTWYSPSAAPYNPGNLNYESIIGQYGYRG
jgi:hypothetical protein